MKHDGLRVRYPVGEVLGGTLTPEEAMKREALRTAWVSEWREGKKGTYESVTEYDPVLRSSCRLGKAGMKEEMGKPDAPADLAELIGKVF